MKKVAKNLALALTVFSTVALSSCSIKEKEDFALDYSYTDPTTGKTATKEITAQDILDRYITRQGSTSAKAYYDTIYEVALRQEFSTGKFKDRASYIKNQVETSIKEEKDKANSSNVSWETYLNDTLGYTDSTMSTSDKEHALYLDKEVSFMKEEASDKFYESFKQRNPEKDTASEEDIKLYNMVYGENGYLNTKLPYHVRDIIIKVDADASNYTTGEISSTNAKDLYDLISELTRSKAGTNTYSDIANKYSDDTTSSSVTDDNLAYGEHLMDLDTSFINEFKLGIYTYDSLFNEETKDNSLKENFLMPSDVEEDLENIGVRYIPYEAVVKLNEYKDVEKYKDPTTGQELTVNEGLTKYYPRNIIFNKYFNSHNISFIVNEKVDSSDPENEYVLTDTGVTVKSDINEDGSYNYTNEAYFEEGTSEALHFQAIEGLDKEVLCDEKGNPIIVTRSETSNAGIHFVVIEKSALEDQTTADVKLNEYYAPVTPILQNGQDSEGNPYYNSDFPTDETGSQLSTFVNSNFSTNVEGYNKRVNYLKNKFESYTSSKKEYQIFEWITGNAYKANNATVQAKIDQYIESNLASVDLSNATSLKDSWNSYDVALLEQEDQRQLGLIPETCAIHFGDSDYYGKGKLCYYTSSLDTNGGNN